MWLNFVYLIRVLHGHIKHTLKVLNRHIFRATQPQAKSLQLGIPRTSEWFAGFDLHAAQEVMPKLRNGKRRLPLQSHTHVLEDARLSCALSMVRDLELREMRARMRGEVPLR